MILVKFFQKFLVQDKENISLDDYIHNFKRKETYYNVCNSNELFVPLLEELYKTDKAVYEGYYKVFNKVSYDVLKRVIPVVTEIVKDNGDPQTILEVMEMVKRESSIISRTTSKYKNPNPDRSNYKKYFLELEKTMEIIKDNDNPLVDTCISQFKESYKTKEDHLKEIQKKMEELIKNNDPLMEKCVKQFMETHVIKDEELKLLTDRVAENNYIIVDNIYLKKCYDLCISRIPGDIKSSMNDIYKGSKYLYERYCNGKNFDDYVISKVKKKEY